MRHRALCLAVSLVTSLVVCELHAAVDREKLLSNPGVYGTFAVFRLTPEWWKMDGDARRSAIVEAKQVLQQHADKLVVDLYLLRGLSDRADFMVRIHSGEISNNQHLLVDLMGSGLGKHLENTYVFNGLTKKLNYVPGFSGELKEALKPPTEPGPKPYAIVIPIKKDAEWWLLSQEARTELMKEHTEASVPYVKTVKRKLYHSNGLDDLDFITYFETARLDDFNQLIIALQQVKENRHNKRFGSPTILATAGSTDEIFEMLAR